MQDAAPGSRTEAIFVRLTPEAMKIIEQAAAAEGRNRAQFLRHHALEAAKETIAQKAQAVRR
jgi:uncharacterized protein (DUF1778 family)